MNARKNETGKETGSLNDQPSFRDWLLTSIAVALVGAVVLGMLPQTPPGKIRSTGQAPSARAELSDPRIATVEMLAAAPTSATEAGTDMAFSDSSRTRVKLRTWLRPGETNL